MVAMLKVILILLFLFQDPPISISSPQAGDTLRGQVEIVGRMGALNFSSAELAFSYASDTADSWFIIQAYPQAETGSIIAVWDTIPITDGDYDLRLRVFLQDGSFQDVLISGLKVRNDLPGPTDDIPAETVSPQFDAATPMPAFTAPPDVPVITHPSSTPLPVNPASVTASSIYSIFGRGALVVLVLFAFFSLILRLRKNN